MGEKASNKCTVSFFKCTVVISTMLKLLKGKKKKNHAECVIIEGYSPGSFP